MQMEMNEIGHKKPQSPLRMNAAAYAPS
jgi:hypothetical protein